jgi:hypothetical protein
LGKGRKEGMGREWKMGVIVWELVLERELGKMWGFRKDWDGKSGDF